MNLDQLRHYQSKLAYEMDSWDLHVAISNGEPFVVVDGRSEAAFAQEHIPGAINLPHRGICTFSTEALDKSKTYVCYCDGIGCNASTKTALKLLTLDFKVRELIGGLDWWKRDGYQTAGSEGRAGTPVGAVAESHSPRRGRAAYCCPEAERRGLQAPPYPLTPPSAACGKHRIPPPPRYSA